MSKIWSDYFARIWNRKYYVILGFKFYLLFVFDWEYNTKISKTFMITLSGFGTSTFKPITLKSETTDRETALQCLNYFIAPSPCSQFHHHFMRKFFLYKIASSSFFLVTFWLCNFFGAKILAQKRKMLMKSTPEWPSWYYSRTCLSSFGSSQQTFTQSITGWDINSFLIDLIQISYLWKPILRF